MELVLHGAPLSPYVRKVRVTLALKHVACTLDPIDPWRQAVRLRELNPIGRIPVLEVDGRPLCESSVICHYLDEVYPEPPLLPAEPWARARARWFERYADTELGPLLTFAVFGQRVIRPLLGQPVDEAQVRAAIDERLPPLLDWLEAELGDRDWLVGAGPTLADLAFATHTVNYGYGGEALDPTRHPRLCALAARTLATLPFAALLAEEAAVMDKVRARLARP
ncbi:glutathione S-transferase [Plasticicumulans lactativorans]|uniref:Glutathione S-transferase n=1 Tax=Plasticicumulans lactativorans TaxID=1133106 RepID=A0A4R2L3A2_9GAMM|nr:glutathione S-transferase family protein [Plasticicumulans lactativorans]TCO80853.1 glutathione S-transferase [Plasticicumulans lactativorans]